MLQNINSCGEVITPSLKLTMLTMLIHLVALKQQSLASKQGGGGGGRMIFFIKPKNYK